MADNAPIRFGTDGWRGVIAGDFTFANVRRVSAAAARYFRSQPDGTRRPVLIGYDRRFFSREFAETVAHVFQAHGLRQTKVVRSPMTTPSLSVMVVHEKAAWGIMITASHNPALYNGFKIKSAEGRSAAPSVTDEIERLLQEAHPTPADEKPRGEPCETFAFEAVYDAYLKSRLSWKLLRGSNARVVFDPLYGVGAGIPERLFKNSPLNLFSIHTGHDPLFGGLHPEPIDPYLKELKAEVLRRKAIVGIATDGDADRLGVVDDRGRTLTPHQVFPLLALHAIEYQGRRGKIVQSVSLGVLGERIAKKFGLPFEEIPVGFKHVADRMVNDDILAGGEESGGYAFRGGLPERDGVLCGLMFLEMCVARHKRPSQLVAEMEKRFGGARFRRMDRPLPQPIVDKNGFVGRLLSGLPNALLRIPIAEKRTTDGLKIVLQDGSWVLLRPSGTEPLIRLYAETDRWEKTNALLLWATSLVSEIQDSALGLQL